MTVLSLDERIVKSGFTQLARGFHTPVLLWHYTEPVHKKSGKNRWEIKIMKMNWADRGMKKRVALIAMALAVAIPFAVMAEAANQTTAATGMPSTASAVSTGVGMGGMHGRSGNGFGMGADSLGACGLYNYADTSEFTDAQKTAYDGALNLYGQVEDAVLNDLVIANVLSQADVDTYHALQTAQKSLADLDRTAWTADQYKAYYEANAKTGDDRKTAMQALADAGQLTQNQADALSAQGQSDLWTKIAQNASTNSAIQTAVSTLQQARQTMNKTLNDAGISVKDNGGMNFGFGMGMMDNNQGQNQNDNGNHMNGRMGNRN
jgi:hypothetical protein